MKNKMLIVTLVVLNVAYAERAKNREVFVNYKDWNHSDQIQVSHMPPTSSQMDLNWCAPVSVQRVLEQRYCVKNRKDCNLKAEERISLVHIGRSYSYVKGKRSFAKKEEGVSSAGLLEIIKELEKLRLAKSVCAPDNEWLPQIEAYLDIDYEYQRLLSTTKCRDHALLTKVAIEKRRKDLEKYGLDKDFTTLQLQGALFSNELRSSLADSAIEKECLDKNYIDVPNYQIEGYPKKTQGDISGYREKIMNNIKANTPVIVGLCLDKGFNSSMPPSSGCNTTHAIVLSGMRKSCLGQTCKLMYKVENSWGQEWQNKYDNGWVDAENLEKYMQTKSMSLTWLEDPAAKSSSK